MAVSPTSAPGVRLMIFIVCGSCPIRRSVPMACRSSYVVAWVDPDDHTRYRSQLMLVPFDGSAPARALTSRPAPRYGAALVTRWLLAGIPLGPPRRSVATLPSPVARRRAASAHVAEARRRRPRLVTRRRPHSLQRAGRHRRDRQPGRPDPTKRASRRGSRSSPASATRPTARASSRRCASTCSSLAIDHERAPRQVTDGDWDDAEPAWSPDGEWLAFTVEPRAATAI